MMLISVVEPNQYAACSKTQGSIGVNGDWCNTRYASYLQLWASIKADYSKYQIAFHAIAQLRTICAVRNDKIMLLASIHD
jgi:hypothetical protein